MFNYTCSVDYSICSLLTDSNLDITSNYSDVWTTLLVLSKDCQLLIELKPLPLGSSFGGSFICCCLSWSMTNLARMYGISPPWPIATPKIGGETFLRRYRVTQASQGMAISIHHRDEPSCITRLWIYQPATHRTIVLGGDWFTVFCQHRTRLETVQGGATS